MDMKASSDFKLLDRKVVDALVALPEKDTFFRALSFWVGFKSDKVYYEVILNLRTRDGIDLEYFKDKYLHDLDYYYKYDNLVKEGLLVLNNDKLFIPSNLWYISNSVIVRLLEGEVNG